MKPGNQLSMESMVLHPAGRFLEDKSRIIPLSITGRGFLLPRTGNFYKRINEPDRKPVCKLIQEVDKYD